ncbi:unnamed protein product [Kuraishia capsulata CBS 1993]|uniref:Major facilitator superfamily (MFS) profile domain-containing protein n=1 Tax=Kuraishia capsulata CBS 1993 TaxID=1382522 RepID=W6MX90_9ASCO|nr:uncharacterized protein KUCA_T00004458001 [Kuraishia capsulata CBS 1993]CDK28475.1 unnamed protein product [Kuraishia capsulata CBS 1993]
MSDISIHSEKAKELSVDEEAAAAAQKKIFEESNAGDGTHREDHYLHGTQLWICVVALFLCMFLVALDQTIVATILQVVGNHFNAESKVAWIATGFSFSMAVFIQIWGNISIAIGRRYCLFLAVALFEIGSLICALSNSMNMLIGGRVIAGFGGGGIQSLVMVIITEIVPIEKRPIAMSGFAVTFAIASVLGPLVGGAFTTNVSWRWCFYINLPIGAVAAVVVFFVFHPPKPMGKILPKLKIIDWIGFFLMVSGFTLFLLAITFGGNEFPWKSAAVILCFILGGLLIGAFCLWNFKYSKHPLIPAEIIKVGTIDIACVGMFFVFGYFMSAILYVSLYFQVVKGYDALDSGVSLLPTILPVVISSMATGIATTKTGHIKPFTILGGLLGPLGTGLLCLLNVHSGVSQRIGCQIVLGLSTGIMMQPFILHIQMAAPKTPGSSIIATTLFNFSRNLGAAVGSDLSQLVYTSTLSAKMAALKGTPAYYSAGLDKYDLDALINDTAQLKKLAEPAKEIVLNVFMAAFKNIFYMSIGFASIAFVSTLFMPNHRLPKKSKGVVEEKSDESEERKDENHTADEAPAADTGVETKSTSQGNSE